MQNGETKKTELFDTIGHGAEQVDNIDDEDEQSQRLVEEIESMCINCEENVSRDSQVQLTLSGHNKIAVNEDSFLPRSYSHVIFLSPLWYYLRIATLT
jgi:hypothetical protein